jgi:hypothetical protein
VGRSQGENLQFSAQFVNLYMPQYVPKCWSLLVSLSGGEFLWRLVLIGKNPRNGAVPSLLDGEPTWE